MFIELNDTNNSIVCADKILYIKYDIMRKTATILFAGNHGVTNSFHYSSKEELVNDKRRIKNRLGL